MVMAQHFGAGNQEMVKKTFLSDTIVNLLAGVLLTVAGVMLAKPLLWIIDTPEDIMEEAVTYLSIMFLGVLANCLYNGMSAVLRALGDSITPLAVLIICSLLNVALDMLFVLGFSWGVAGVAVATILSQLISAAACIAYALYRMPMLRFHMNELHPQKAVIMDIV